MLFCWREALSCSAVDRLVAATTPPLTGPFLIVVQVHVRHAGGDLESPLLEFLLEVCCATGTLRDEVFCFSDVVREMVEFNIARTIEVFDQFPVTLADTAGGSVMVVVWVVPVNRIPGQASHGIGQHGFEAQAVNRLGGR